MKVRFLECTSAVAYSRPGIERELDEPLARHLIKLGHAEAVDPAETAMLSAPETATARPRRKRGLGGLFPQP